MYYDLTPDPTLLYQGDVIKDFIVPDPPEQIFIVRNLPEGIPPTVTVDNKNLSIRLIAKEEDTNNAFSLGKEALVIDATLTNVAIVSQSCDIDRKPFLTIAVVRPITAIQSKTRREDLKRWDKVLEYFWLPASTILEESFIDLTLLYSVRAETLKAKIVDRILTMDINHRYRFKHKVAQYFNRPDE